MGLEKLRFANRAGSVRYSTDAVQCSTRYISTPVPYRPIHTVHNLMWFVGNSYFITAVKNFFTISTFETTSLYLLPRAQT